MSADGNEVRAQRIRAERELQKRLYRVGVQQRPGAVLAQKPRNLADGEHTAGLVVHEHHGDERRVLTQRVRDLLRGDIPLTVGREIGDGIALLLQLTARLEHGAVLHGGGDDVLSDAAVLVGGKADGPVVALRAAGGEVQLVRLAAERGGDDRAVRLQTLFRGGAVGILRAGVAAAV